MTPEDRRAAILRLRKLVDADVRESKIARAQVPGPVAVAARAAAPAATSPRYCPDDCVATLVSLHPCQHHASSVGLRRDRPPTDFA